MRNTSPREHDGAAPGDGVPGGGPRHTRRTVVRAGLLGAGALIAGKVPGSRALAAPVSPMVFGSPSLTPFVDELPRLPMIPASGTLVAAPGAHRFHRDLPPSTTWGYGGQSYGGPVLEAHRDDPVELQVINRLGPHPMARHLDLTLEGSTADDIARPRTITHLHGGLTEPGSDGHPLQGARPLAPRSHYYGGRQQAAGLWYHDHAMGITRLNVYAGLAGSYLLRDEFDTGRADNPLGLPTGDFELPLVIQDKIFTRDGALGYRLARYVPEGSWEGGQAGDVPVVNGVAWPRTDVARGLYRLRLVNGSNARSYRLRLSGGLPFFVVGNDQGLLDAPVRCPQITLAAGERLDVLVDFSGLAPGTEVTLENTERLSLQFLVTGADVRIRQLMRFRVGMARGWRGGVPARLRGGPGLPPRLERWPAPVRRRQMQVLQLWDSSRFPPAMMSLNNLPFASRDTERMRPGTVELWEVANFTTDEHPIHVHLATTRVHSRQAFMAAICGGMHRIPAYGVRYAPPIGRYAYGRSSGPRPWEIGDKDTVWAPPGTITRLLVRWPTVEECGFDPDATFVVPSTVDGGAPGMTLAAERMPMSMHAVNTGPLGDGERAAHRAAAVPQGAHPMGMHEAMGHGVRGGGRIGAAVLGHAGHALRGSAEHDPPRANGTMEVARRSAVRRPDGSAVAVCRLGPEIQPEPGVARGYVWHCHILDHEDHDMMQAFRVVD
jgi:FtsP/CotA-like multicopper oxidase with cupredoxin domain